MITFTLALLVLLGLDQIELSSQHSITNYSLLQLHPGDRSVTINSTQIINSKNQYQSIDRYIKGRVTAFSGGRITQEAIFSELSDLHGVRFNLGAINSLSLNSDVQLTSGRWPRPCTNTSCEVILIGGQAHHLVNPAPFGLTVVGVGSISNTNIFTGTMSPSSDTSLLLSNDISGISALPKFANNHGTDAWVTNLDFSKINTEGTTRFIAQVIAFEDKMSLDLPNMILSWPQDAVNAAGDQSQQFAQKILLINFLVISLLLSFLAISGYRNRREQIKFRASLSRIGTPKRTLIWEVILESASPIFAGTLLAIPLSPLIVWIFNSFNYHADIPLTYSHWSAYLLLSIAASFLLMGMSIFRSRLSTSSFVFFCTIFLISLALLFGVSGVHNFSLLLASFAYAFAPTVICFFSMHYLLVFFRKYVKDRYLILREYISVWRSVAVMLSFATILAMLSIAFNSGISESVNQRSRDLVPLDLSIKVGKSLVRPLDIASSAQYSALIPGSVAYPILRTGSSIRSQGTVSDSLALIGVPLPALIQSDITLKSFGSDVKELAFNSENSLPIRMTTIMSVQLKGIPPQIDLSGWFLTPNGLRVSALFQGSGELRTLTLGTLKGAIPPDSSLIAFEFQESSNELSRRLHASGEGNYSIPAIKGVGSIVKVSIDGVNQNLSTQIWRDKNFPYSFDGNNLYVRPQPNQSIPEVITDPLTAKLAVNGILTLSNGGNSYFQVRVGVVRNYFPSAGDRFVVMELSQLQNELSKSNIGAADPIELWVSTPYSGAYLARMKLAPYSSVATESRAQLSRTFASDPNGVGLVAAYRVSLLFALLLALFMAWSALPMLRTDAANTLYYLETTGITPKEIRESLRTALLTSLCVGILTGSLLGIVVARMYISNSIPYLFIAYFIGFVGVVSWAGAKALLSTFFSEKRVVNR